MAVNTAAKQTRRIEVRLGMSRLNQQLQSVWYECATTFGQRKSNAQGYAQPNQLPNFVSQLVSRVPTFALTFFQTHTQIGRLCSRVLLKSWASL